MSVTNLDIQIKNAYSDGLTPEEISQNLELELETVKASLAVHCPLYRRSQGKDSITDEEYHNIYRALYDIATNASVPEKDRIAAAKFLIQDKKGMFDAKVLSKDVGNVNVLVVNNRLAKMRQLAPPPIDVDNLKDILKDEV